MGQQPRQERDRSMRVAAREMGEMPTDLGLLPRMTPISDCKIDIPSGADESAQKPSSSRLAPTGQVSSDIPEAWQGSPGYG